MIADVIKSAARRGRRLARWMRTSWCARCDRVLRAAVARRRGRGHAVGVEGERLAARFLTDAGYRVLARNWRAGRREADLLCRSPRGVLVLVEVKTSASPMRRPEVRAGVAKRRTLRSLARDLLRRTARGAEVGEGPVRVDLVAIELVQGRPPALRHHRAIDWVMPPAGEARNPEPG